MQKSFGKAIGRAALVKPNQVIFYIETSGEKQIKAIRKTLATIKSKLPCKIKVLVEKVIAQPAVQNPA